MLTQLKKSAFPSFAVFPSMGGKPPLWLIKSAIALPLLIWMAISLANLFWRVLPQPALQEVNITAASRAFAPIEDSSRPPVDINALKDIALFGKVVAPVPQAVETVQEPVKETLEATKLNLKLVGSFANTNPGNAYAIIEKGNNQSLYRVYEAVAGLSDVTLINVFSDRVVLNNRGRREALYMYPEGEPITASGSFPNQSILESAEPDTDRTGTSAGNAEQVLEKISDVIRFSRKTEDGKMLGFRVLPGRNRDAFEQTGLKLNDVVTAIDGQELDNLQAANRIYRQKRNETRANLTVLRGEEELTVDIDLNTIEVN